MAKQSPSEIDAKALSASDAVRDAVIYKLAKDAESQFWDRLKRPFIRGSAIVAVMLGVIGISAWSLVPGWIRDITESAIEDSLKREFDSYRDDAEALRKRTVERLADSEITAARVRTKLTDLETEGDNMGNDLKDQRLALNEAIMAGQLEMRRLRATLEGLAVDSSALAKILDVDLKMLEEQVRQVENIAASGVEAEKLVEWTTKVDGLSKKLEDLNSRFDSMPKPPGILTGSIDLQEFMANAREIRSQKRVQAGMTYEEYESRVAWNRDFTGASVFADVQDFIQADGVPPEFRPSITASIDEVEAGGFTLRLGIMNSTSIRRAKIIWLATRTNAYSRLSRR